MLTSTKKAVLYFLVVCVYLGTAKWQLNLDDCINNILWLNRRKTFNGGGEEKGKRNKERFTSLFPKNIKNNLRNLKKIYCCRFAVEEIQNIPERWHVRKITVLETVGSWRYSDNWQSSNLQQSWISSRVYIRQSYSKMPLLMLWKIIIKWRLLNMAMQIYCYI